MTEADTRAELIDPHLRKCGWGVVEGSKILRELHAQFTDGRISLGGQRLKPLIPDYILTYRGKKLAVVEAKSEEVEVGEGVAQAKLYAEKLGLLITYATNGKEIYQIDMESGLEGLVDTFLTPDQIWQRTFPERNSWQDKFDAVPTEDRSGTWKLRYYQEIAINKTLEAIAQNKQRILLTMATGTGKTAIAFQVAWKLFHAKWNLRRDGSRRPRILFLADRNILADQAFNAFNAFPEDALVRIKPHEIKKRGMVPTNGSIFFTIYQTFMTGTDAEGSPAPYFGEYPPDYFDFIVIDECHRGGANDESNWRAILEYFSPAVQLGLTATPRRDQNIDTYRYFGEPVSIYSLKDGIADGFLTPFRVKRIKTTLDEYEFASDDTVIEGEVEMGKRYLEPDFNVSIEIKEREAKRVQLFMDDCDQTQKSIIFCANQAHAALVRDLVNQYKRSSDPNYCVRVTANDADIGEQFLRQFQDNEKTIPTILTTSQKLSTGVDARNIRNIVIMRPIHSMIEFKQIIGRGTRLYDNKHFFTIYDFVDAHHHFADSEWDGEPIDVTACPVCNQIPCVCKHEPRLCQKCGQLPCICLKEPPAICPECGQSPCVCMKNKLKIKLRDGKEREIDAFTETLFYTHDGKMVTVAEFLDLLFGHLPDFFSSEAELRRIWSNPVTRQQLLDQLAQVGFGKDELSTIQKILAAEDSDVLDVLEYILNSEYKPITRQKRVASAKTEIMAPLTSIQADFIQFVMSRYQDGGYEELDIEKLPKMLELKYRTLSEAESHFGGLQEVEKMYLDFQKKLYQVPQKAGGYY